MTQASAELALQARGLRKSFGELEVLRGIDLELPSGKCLGLLGPNGAGKTTAIEILEGLQKADAGQVEIFGMQWAKDAKRIRECIGVQLQETQFQDKLTAFEVLRLFRSFYSQGKSVEEVLEMVSLVEKRKARIKTLSGGQKQRLAIACALLSDPKLLFLDEPSTGLDPQARRRVWEIIQAFKEQGGSVLLTTHYMDEAERLSDDLLIVDEGQVIAKGSPASIISGLGAESFVEFEPLGESMPSDEQLLALGGVEGVGHEMAAASSGNEKLVRLAVSNTQATIAGLLSLLAAGGHQVEGLRTHRPTLEDVFVNLTGKHLRDA
jgi:ABC-2 type transport system ATP-binding protein